MNRLVWVQGEKEAKTGSRDQKNYGVSTKRFSDNRSARAYAFKLAKERGDKKLYDKYYGEYVPVKKSVSSSKRQFKSNVSDTFGFGWW